MKYKIIRTIAVVLLVLGVTVIILSLMEGKKSIVGSIGSGGGAIAVGGALMGVSVGVERREKASRDSSK